MAHWLYKSEPFKWSWDQQVAAGAKGTHWDGVRNHLAKQQLLAMKIGDRGFFYHSNEGKEIVGIVEVIREAYPDPSDPSGKFVMVDVKAVEALKNPVSLAAVKTEPRLTEMALMKFSRLSVQPVTDAEWDIVLEMADGTR
ncbi:EVE domain-containing protein [Ancylobacter vacuolatus]|uniref:RNA-binding protein with PUA-like domain n=1 Tax=Ancylobacter vacuolatus TaxID=223389 RepID=A0ABU0DN19_9HYPH|nr:EVE domain-containing protein [Ancylobacter vacuolatus]MDQ0349849.1 putative RNA-binding protein with PUA-like domain [Ancylobacter vacuolatus]